MVPEKGVFQPWGDGVRACPGKRFGQVEHIAAMATIFRQHVVRPAVEAGETPVQTTARIERVIADNGTVLNFQLLHPEKAALVWRRLSEKEGGN